MYEDFDRQFYGEDLPSLVRELHSVVQNHWHLKANGREYGGQKLKDQLYGVMEGGGDVGLQQWRTMRQYQEEWMDDHLCHLTETVKQVLMPDQEIQKAYVVRTKCNSCDETRANQQQVIPVSDYVFERDFDPLRPIKELYDAGLSLMCQHGCGVATHVTSSSNLMVPTSDMLNYIGEAEIFGMTPKRYSALFSPNHPLISRVQARQKSAQGLVEKMTKIISFNPHNASHRMRSIVDKFALQIGIDDIEPKKLMNFFFETYGISVREAAQPAISLGSRSRVPESRRVTKEKFENLEPLDKIHYGLLGFLMEAGKTRGFNFTNTLDDKVIKPKKNGYKSIQAHIKYTGKLFELQIKPESVAIGEITHGVPYFHPSYHDVENRIWEETLDKLVEPHVVEVLWGIWGDNKKLTVDIKKIIGMQE